MVVQSGEFPEVPNSRVNPDHQLLGTRVHRSSSYANSTFNSSGVWWLSGEKSLEAINY
jgi:hypothetical protein